MATRRGTAGNDRLSGTASEDVINGLDGNDVLDVGRPSDAHGDFVNGGTGIDTLVVDFSAQPRGTSFTAPAPSFIANSLAHARYVNIEQFWLSGSLASDRLTGGAWDDRLSGGGDDDRLNGGAGDDRLSGGTGDDRLGGDDGNDVLTGGSGADVMSGERGNDVIDAGTAATAARDRIDGGAGIDTLELDLSATSAGQRIVVASGVQAERSLGTLRYAGIENFDLELGRGADTVTLGRGDDAVQAGAGDDVLRGGGGADRLSGGDGNDRIDLGLAGRAGGSVVDGGRGSDTLVASFANSASAVTFEAAAGAGKGSLASVSYEGIERFDITGGAAGDSLKGAAGADRLAGGGGNDELDGGTGIDTIDGGAGDDTITFGAFALDGDVVRGGAGTDTLVLDWWGGATMKVVAGGVTRLADGTLISGIENFSIDTEWVDNDITTAGGADYISSGLDDVVSGGAGDDVIEAWHGSDTVDAGAGDDRVAMRYDGRDRADGGSGDDLMVVDAGTEYEWATLPALGDLLFRVDATGLATLSGGDSRAEYRNFERFEVQGGDGDDTLRGGSAADRLAGGSGQDVLGGGGGADTLVGGGGADVLGGGAGGDAFVLTPLGSSIAADRITDFTRGSDTLQFALASLGADSRDDIGLTLGDEAEGGRAQFLFVAATRSLWFDADGSGDQDARLVATLDGVTALSSDDFMFV